MASRIRDFLGRLNQTARAFWNAARGRYEDIDGQALADSGELVVLVEQRISQGLQNVFNLVTPLANGQVSVGEWQGAFAAEIRRAHVQMYALGRGGFEQLSRGDIRTIERHLTFEFQQLRQFARDVEAGLLSEAQIRQRMGMYQAHIQQSFWEGNRAAKATAGLRQERRLLNPAEHCDDCIGYAAQGWVAIGTLPPPGQESQCMANCKCTMEFR